MISVIVLLTISTLWPTEENLFVKGFLSDLSFLNLAVFTPYFPNKMFVLLSINLDIKVVLTYQLFEPIDSVILLFYMLWNMYYL